MRSPNTFVGFDLANWSSSSKWSCTNVVGCVVDGGAHEQRRSRIMAKREYHTEQTEGATPFGLIPAVLITMGRQHTPERAKAHSARLPIRCSKSRASCSRTDSRKLKRGCSLLPKDRRRNRGLRHRDARNVVQPFGAVAPALKNASISSVGSPPSASIAAACSQIGWIFSLSPLSCTKQPQPQGCDGRGIAPRFWHVHEIPA